MTTKLLRTLMGMVALVAMLTACSSEDVLLDEPNAKNEITFNVTTNRASRAVQVFNKKEDLKYFRFSAWEHGGDPVYNQQYALKDIVVNEGSIEEPKWINQGGLRYWPNNGATLDFYAWCCGTAEPTAGDHASFNWKDDVNYTSGPTLSFNVKADAKDQTDLIYAVAQGTYKASDAAMGSSKEIKLDFHHALSQIVFTVENTSNKLHIEIDKISICNIQDQGDFLFPFNEKSAKWELTSTYAEKTFTANYQDTQTVTKKDPETGKTTTEEQVNSEWLDLGLNTVKTYSTDKTALMMLPVGEFGEDDTTTGYPTFGDECPYISIMCKIWNVANPNDKESDKYGWNSKDNLIYGSTSAAAELRIPISGKWEMNHRYVYHLIFGKGNAGYNADGKAAIVPMSYDYLIQGWGNDEEINETEPSIENFIKD